jgi:hypothetical protein
VKCEEEQSGIFSFEIVVLIFGSELSEHELIIFPFK